MTYTGLKFVLDEKALERLRAAVGQILIDQNPRVHPVTSARAAGRITDRLEALMIVDGMATIGE